MPTELHAADVEIEPQIPGARRINENPHASRSGTLNAAHVNVDAAVAALFDAEERRLRVLSNRDFVEPTMQLNQNYQRELALLGMTVWHIVHDVAAEYLRAKGANFTDAHARAVAKHIYAAYLTGDHPSNDLVQCENGKITKLANDVISGSAHPWRGERPESTASSPYSHTRASDKTKRVSVADDLGTHNRTHKDDVMTLLKSADYHGHIVHPCPALPPAIQHNKSFVEQLFNTEASIYGMCAILSHIGKYPSVAERFGVHSQSSAKRLSLARSYCSGLSAWALVHFNLSTPRRLAGLAAETGGVAGAFVRAPRFVLKDRTRFVLWAPRGVLMQVIVDCLSLKFDEDEKTKNLASSGNSTDSNIDDLHQVPQAADSPVEAAEKTETRELFMEVLEHVRARAAVDANAEAILEAWIEAIEKGEDPDWADVRRRLGMDEDRFRVVHNCLMTSLRKFLGDMGDCA